MSNSGLRCSGIDADREAADGDDDDALGFMPSSSSIRARAYWKLLSPNTTASKVARNWGRRCARSSESSRKPTDSCSVIPPAPERLAVQFVERKKERKNGKWKEGETG